MTGRSSPAIVPPPGERLLDEIESRGWTQQDFAKIISRPPQVISEIIAGKKQITAQTALEFGKAFGTSAEFWNRLEADHQLHMLKKKPSDGSIETKSHLYKLLPVRELLQRGWLRLKDPNDSNELTKELCRFMNVSSVDETLKVAVNFKATDSEKRTPEARAQIAWVLRVQNLARQQTVKEFCLDSLDNLVEELLKLTTNPGSVKKVPQLLKDFGIRFVIVPHLQKTYADGAAFRLDGDERKPVIAVTLRYDRNDNFWFVLLHELAHIYNRHPDILLETVIDKDGQQVKSEIEQEADSAARNWLINVYTYQDFVEENFHEVSDEKIITFAKKVKRHPGIVVGRLQRDGLLNYSQSRHLLEKVSFYFTEIVDRA